MVSGTNGLAAHCYLPLINMVNLGTNTKNEGLEVNVLECLAINLPETAWGRPSQSIGYLHDAGLDVGSECRLSTDEAERLLGILDERTKGILLAVIDVRTNITELFSRSDEIRSRVDTLSAEHKERIKNGASCTQTVNVPTMPKLMLAAMTGGSSIVGGGIVLILILVLKKWGLL